MNSYSTISIEWDEETLDRNIIHRELTELAMEHISTMVLDGFVSGELSFSIYDRILGEDIEYSGSWRIHYSN